MSTTGTAIITGALQTLGVIAPDETPSATMVTDALRRLNLMVDQWSLQSLTKPVMGIETFALTSDKGGLDNPYTIGVGGDFNTARPNEADLDHAGLVLGNSDPVVEIPCPIITDSDYQNIQVKLLSSPLFTAVYYNQTYTNDLGTLILWPVPNTAANSIRLYMWKSLASFTTAGATYQLPRGLGEALEYNLAVRLAGPYGRTLDPSVVSVARESFANFKRSNVSLVDLPQDPALTSEARGGYNIVTGTGGGSGS